MDYLRKVQSRLDVPGVAILAAGCLLAIFSEKAAVRFFKGSRAAEMVMKAAGLAAAVFGALVVLDIIQIW